MYLIQLNANAEGCREPLINWNNTIIPEGYALCPDEFYDVFYSTTPVCGFVDITLNENKFVTSMSVNYTALENYMLAHPVTEEEQPVDIVKQLEEENKKLNETLQSQSEQIALLEGCVIELAQKVYS